MLVMSGDGSRIANDAPEPHERQVSSGLTLV
jgi:hypothetical protein